MLTHILAVLASNFLVLYAMEHEDVDAQQRVEADEAVAIDGGHILIQFGTTQIKIGTTPNGAQQQEKHKETANVKAGQANGLNYII